MEPKQLIRDIILRGTPAEKKALFGFDNTTSNEGVVKRFRLFGRGLFPRYFESKDAPFHDEMDLNFVRSYGGEADVVEAGFRGSAKTSRLKVFTSFVLLNDRDAYRKYIKVRSLDLINAKQSVTDIYNMMVEVRDLYGDPFEREGDKKREETMTGFTMKKGVKLSAGSILQTQRGHVQDAYRPDWVWLDDIEDVSTVSSVTITDSLIKATDEALQGLSVDGSVVATSNYISDSGVVHWLMNRKGMRVHKIPIIDSKGNPTWPARYTPSMVQAIREKALDWAGDYLVDPTKAGDKFFDLTRIDQQLAQAKPPTRTSGEGIRYWGSYDPEHRYGMGEDLADGTGGDSCALTLFDFTGFGNVAEQVASADDNQTPPDLFTYEAARVGAEFGNCIIAPEINNTCGGIAISALKDREYPNIYIKEYRDKVGNVLSTKLGWETNAKTRPEMFYEFRRDWNNGLVRLNDERILREMRQFTKADLSNRSQGAVTRHFDLLTSCVIAWQMRDHAAGSSKVRKFYRNLEAENAGKPGSTVARS